MKRILLVVTAILIVGATVVTARTIDVWGQMFDVGDPAPMTVDVGVLKQKNGSHKMNYVKLKNGHMMAVVPLEEFLGLSKMTNENDMLQ